jgi:Domain of unknown function (DUF3806)
MRAVNGEADQTIEALNDAELDWVDQNLQSASAFVRSYVGDDAAIDPESLDAAFERWLQAWLGQPESERDDPNPYINVFGIAFGQRLVDDLGFEWKVVTDAYGTEMAVLGQPGDQLVFPPNLVAKRFVARETRFMQPLYDEIALVADRLRRGEDPTAPSP